MVILPVLIFTARVADVTLGTLRILFVSKSMKLLATLAAFLEVMIWVLAIAQIMQDLGNVINYIAFAGGFAIGTFVGISIEEKMAMGLATMWIVTEDDATELINRLKLKKYVVTSVGARGLKGEVRIVFTIMKRKDMNEIIDVVKKLNPNAFVSTSDIRAIKVKNADSTRKIFTPFAKLRRLPVATIRSQRKGK
jgi:uncharacterized protein YebE (UPF0316 family)